MHTLEEMTRFVGIFLDTAFTGEERHVRRIAMLTDYESTGDLPPLPDVRARATMPEGHTLRRLADDLDAAFAGRPVRVSSPQGRFAADAALVDGQVLVGADSAGKHLFVEFAGDRYVHVHLGLIGKFDLRPAPAPAAGRPGAAAAAERDDVRRPPRRHPVRPDRRRAARARCSPRSARTRCGPTPTR